MKFTPKDKQLVETSYPFDFQQLFKLARILLGTDYGPARSGQFRQLTQTKGLIMKFLKSAVAAAVAVAGVLMSAGPASAAPLFTINPDAIPGSTAGVPFVADQISVSLTSELLHLNATGATVTSGYGLIGGFADSTTSSNILAGVSRIGVDFNMYLLFDLETKYLSGGTGNGTSGSHYEITSLNFSVWADPFAASGLITTFQAASAAGAGTEATRTGNFADDIPLAIGSLIPGSFNTADLTGGGGAALNALTTFGVCQGGGTANFGGIDVVVGAVCGSSIGSAFFAAPNPFYQLAFTGLNNAGGGVARNGDLVSVNNAGGTVIFRDIPEPSSLALLGISLAGLGLVSRRRKINK